MGDFDAVAGVAVSETINPQKIDALILCGGLGTRFREIRGDIPKALAPIRSKKFIDLLLDDLVRQGIRRIILATGYLGDQITEHLHTRRDAELVFSWEPEPLGTGGAIKYAQPLLISDPVLVLNGDSQIDFSICALLKKYWEQDADMVILLSQISQGKDYGSVTMDATGRIIEFAEKPKEISTLEWVNAGVYLLSQKLIESIRPSHPFSIEKELIPHWIKTRVILIGLATNQTVFDIGTPERYQQFQLHTQN